MWHSCRIDPAIPRPNQPEEVRSNQKSELMTIVACVFFQIKNDVLSVMADFITRTAELAEDVVTNLADVGPVLTRCRPNRT